MAASLSGAIQRHAHRMPGLMLLALHVGVAWGLDSALSSALITAHFGLFLLWQPLWRGAGDLPASQVLLVLAIAALLAMMHNWWLIALWVAALTALTGGEAPLVASWRQRAAALLAALYLLALLLVWIVPHLAVGDSVAPVIDPLQTAVVRYGLPFIAAAVLILNERRAPAALEPVYTLMLFLLVAALVLGSLVLLGRAGGGYAAALVEALLFIAATLAALSWLMRPTAGFDGLGQMWTRFLMSVGVPFEPWVQQLARIADAEPDAARFLHAAAGHLTALPWIIGVRWESRLASGHRGRLAGHEARFDMGELHLTLHTRWALTPAMLLHVKLLAQLTGHFHEAKIREAAERHGAYTRAIHETGSRLTHDVKNLLQSLNALCAAARGHAPGESDALIAMVQRQLPQITQRLAATLDKLQSPDAVAARPMEAGAWWTALGERYRYRNVRLELAGDAAGCEVDAELFDSVADNLIDNALREAPEAVVRFNAPARVLTVSNAGGAVPNGVVAQLFEGPVPSQTGLGVGLYHASQLARRKAYELNLTHNTAGHVEFCLRPWRNA
jgi:signal transduction histidine kinase